MVWKGQALSDLVILIHISRASEGFSKYLIVLFYTKEGGGYGALEQ